MSIYFLGFGWFPLNNLSSISTFSYSQRHLYSGERHYCGELQNQGSSKLSPAPNSSLSTGDLPDPGIKLGSPTLQVDSLPTELPGKLPLGAIGDLISFPSDLFSTFHC